MAQAPGSSRQGAQQGGRRGKGEPPDDLEFVDALIHTPQALEVEERGGGSPGGGGGGELPKPNHLVPAASIEAPKRRETMLHWCVARRMPVPQTHAAPSAWGRASRLASDPLGFGSIRGPHQHRNPGSFQFVLHVLSKPTPLQ